jgi:hypothetical protein
MAHKLPGDGIAYDWMKTEFGFADATPAHIAGDANEIVANIAPDSKYPWIDVNIS